QGTARPLEFRLQAAPRTSSHHAPRDDPHAFLGEFRYRATSVRPRCCQNSDPPNEPVPRLALLAAGALNSTLAVQWAPGGKVRRPAPDVEGTLVTSCVDLLCRETRDSVFVSVFSVCSCS